MRKNKKESRNLKKKLESGVEIGIKKKTKNNKRLKLDSMNCCSQLYTMDCCSSLLHNGPPYHIYNALPCSMQKTTPWRYAYHALEKFVLYSPPYFSCSRSCPKVSWCSIHHLYSLAYGLAQIYCTIF